MDGTQHNDYKAMRPYINIADDIRANAMDKFNQILLKRSEKSKYFDFSERFNQKTKMIQYKDEQQYNNTRTTQRRNLNT